MRQHQETKLFWPVPNEKERLILRGRRKLLVFCPCGPQLPASSGAGPAGPGYEVLLTLLIIISEARLS